jgi:protein TonB
VNQALTARARTWAEVPSRSRVLLFILVAVLHLGAAALISGLQTTARPLQAPAIVQVRWVSGESPVPSSAPQTAPPTAPPANPESRPEPLPVRVPPVVRPQPRPKPAPVLAVSAAVPEYEGRPTAAAEDTHPAELEPAPYGPATSLPEGPATGGGGAAGGDAEFSEPVYDAAYLSNPKPDYPPLSNRLREQGTVTLRIYVTAQGRAEQVLIHQSSGYARLDKSAAEVVRRWRFVPARRGRENIAAWVLVPIYFNLQS